MWSLVIINRCWETLLPCCFLLLPADHYSNNCFFFIPLSAYELTFYTYCVSKSVEFLPSFNNQHLVCFLLRFSSMTSNNSYKSKGLGITCISANCRNTQEASPSCSFFLIPKDQNRWAPPQFDTYWSQNHDVVDVYVSIIMTIRSPHSTGECNITWWF